MLMPGNPRGVRCGCDVQPERACQGEVLELEYLPERAVRLRRATPWRRPSLCRTLQHRLAQVSTRGPAERDREAVDRTSSAVGAVPIPVRATALVLRRWGALADSQAPQKAGATENLGRAERLEEPARCRTDLRRGVVVQAYACRLGPPRPAHLPLLRLRLSSSLRCAVLLGAPASSPQRGVLPAYPRALPGSTAFGGRLAPECIETRHVPPEALSACLCSTT